MAEIRIPFLVAKRNTAGLVTSWHWQPSATLRKAGWEPMALGADRAKAMQAAETRNAEVEAWKLGGAVVQQVKPRPIAGTFGALLDRYEREELNGAEPDGTAKLAASTIKTYKTSLERLRKWAAKFPLAMVTPARVKALRNAMMAPADKGGIGHHAAHQTLKMGRVVMAFAESEDLIAKGSNPFGRFNLGAPPPRAVVWSPAAREAMIITAYDQGQPSIALGIMLGFAIGQREQDIIALIHRRYKPIPQHEVQPEDWRTLCAIAPDGVPRAIEVHQQKTGAWVKVPVVGLVRWAIESAIATARAAGAITILVDDTRQDPARDPRHRKGQNFADGLAGQARFQRDFAEIREWAIAAAQFDGDEELAEELATLEFRDLRRTCVVYLGELGLEDHLIAAITGHDIDETRKILKTYMPRTTGRAARAIALASVREAREADAAAKEQSA